MVLRIRTNIPALTGLRNLQGVTNRMTSSLEKLTSGLRINRAADDPSGLAIATRFRVYVDSIQQASRNTQNAINLAQTADGALNQITGILQRIRTLAVQSADGTNTSLDRATIQTEVDDLVQEISRIASGTQFNDRNLLNGNLATNPLNFFVDIFPEVGKIRLSIPDTRAGAIGVAGLDVSTAAAASTAIGTVDNALSQVSTRQAVVGVAQNRLNFALSFLSGNELTFEATRSAIEDADLAAEVINFTTAQVVSNTATAFLAQANIQPNTLANILLFQRAG